MKPDDKKLSSGGGWGEDTLIDKLDVYIELLRMMDDLLQARAQANQGITAEEVSRFSTVLGIYFRKYEKARSDWLEVVS